MTTRKEREREWYSEAIKGQLQMLYGAALGFDVDRLHDVIEDLSAEASSASAGLSTDELAIKLMLVWRAVEDKRMGKKQGFIRGLNYGGLDSFNMEQWPWVSNFTHCPLPSDIEGLPNPSEMSKTADELIKMIHGCVMKAYDNQGKANERQS